MVYARLHDPLEYVHNFFRETTGAAFGSVSVECSGGHVDVFYHRASEVRAHISELEKLAEKMEADDE